MTNSIASAKCPSVLTSGKYGMSQHRSISDDSKEYIFVKLTDSALRAIEEYQRNNQTKRLQKGQCAKIQFIGNSGVIHFPSPEAGASVGGDGGGGGRKFGFAIDDVEGSLECMQQSGGDLDVLGALNYRMRIHANDDVYDTTRTKMAIAEETEKSKCIREIKPNQTDIGRKVKRPVSAASIQAYTNGSSSSLSGGTGGAVMGSSSSSINGSSSYLSNSSINSSSNNSRNKLSATTTLNQHSPPGGGGVNSNSSRLLAAAASRISPNPSLMGGSGTIGSSNPLNNNPSNRYGSPSNFSSSSLPSLLTSATSCYPTPGNSPPSLGSINNHTALTQNQKKPMARNSLGSKTSQGSKSNGSLNGKNMDVSRRKIRERLIHLLALKPFKKPELYSRLQNEGLAQRERQLISTILKDISTLSRDNTYNLRHSMWNDVDENWPFFSEQEIQQLKRRKPQNLTPPMSSDAGSSTSGQSPTSSTHTGSPPPLVGGMMSGGVAGGVKRASLEPDLYDGSLTLAMQSKKQRISHYKKDGSSSNSMPTQSSVGHNMMGTGTRMGGGGGGAGGGSNGSSYNHRSSTATAYSPHNYNAGSNNNGNDENLGNSDLSFNVLNNMDDFINHTAIVGGDQTFAQRSKTTNGSSNKQSSFSGSTGGTTTSITTTKEKRNSGGSSTSGFVSNRESLASSSTTATSAMRRNNSPTPYAYNFVPETKISSNSSGRYPQQRQTQQQQTLSSSSSPNYNNNHNNKLNHKSNSNSSNSVIPNLNEDYTIPPTTTATATLSSASSFSSSRSRHHSFSSNVRGESSSKHSRSSTPTQKHSNKHNNRNATAPIPQQHQPQPPPHLQHQQPQQQQQQPFNSNAACTPPQNASHSSQSLQSLEHSSPTQQIAAAASTFSLTNHNSTSSGYVPRYDFSSYTPITTIEQRRQYKTEFESDYDEYRKLLAQIESVGRRFRDLADRLNDVQQGCTDYNNIKDQIVSEYNRIRQEEAINRDKQRFDYLHDKLAHIKQLVMEYDKKITGGLTTPTIPLNQLQLLQQQYQQQQQQQQQQQYHQTPISNNSTHLSPMIQSSGESNHSPPLVLVNSTKRSSKYHHQQKQQQQQQHQQQQQQQQQQEHYQQHHEPETIQMDESSLQEHPYDNDNHLHRPTLQQQLAPASLSHSATNGQQQQHQHQQEQQEQSQNHNNDSDSDSDSSSSSSSNDNSDDNSDASDDDDDDDNSDDDSNDNDDQ